MDNLFTHADPLPHVFFFFQITIATLCACTSCINVPPVHFCLQNQEQRTWCLFTKARSKVSALGEKKGECHLQVSISLMDSLLAFVSITCVGVFSLCLNAQCWKTTIDNLPLGVQLLPSPPFWQFVYRGKSLVNLTSPDAKPPSLNST